MTKLLWHTDDTEDTKERSSYFSMQTQSSFHIIGVNPCHLRYLCAIKCTDSYCVKI